MENKKTAVIIILSVLVVDIIDFYPSFLQFMKRLSIYQLGDIAIRLAEIIFIFCISLSLVVKNRKATFLIIGTVTGGLGNLIGLGLMFKNDFITLNGIILKVSFLFFYFSFLGVALSNKFEFPLKEQLLVNIGFLTGFIGWGIICFNKLSASIFSAKLVTIDSIYGLGIVGGLLYFVIRYNLSCSNQ